MNDKYCDNCGRNLELPHMSTCSRHKTEVQLIKEVATLTKKNEDLEAVNRIALHHTGILKQSLDSGRAENTDLEVIARVQEMAEESLDPEAFEMWETVQSVLFNNRQSLAEKES